MAEASQLDNHKDVMLFLGSVLFTSVTGVLCILQSRESGLPLTLRSNGDRDDYLTKVWSSGNNVKGDGRISKRSMRKSAFTGLMAFKRLLRDSKQIPVRSYIADFRKYEKPGDADTALEDFYAVRPTNVQRRPNYDHTHKAYGKEVLSGQAGDRFLILKVEGDKMSNGKPVIEIRKSAGKFYDRIIYKTTHE